MAADRQRLAAALAYEEERRRRMMESVPTTDNLPSVQPSRRSLRTDLENLSSGIGQGVVNQLEGVKALVTDPVGTARAAYEGVKGVVRDPSVLADALRYTAQKATSGPLGAGEVIGEMLGPMRGKPPVMQEIDVYHGSPHRFEEFDASKIGTGEGAQAYGHGIYLAESPNVAKSYATMDSPFAAAGLKGPAATVAALAKIDGQGNPVKFLEDNYESQVKKFGKQDVDAAIASLKRGNLYTADLPDEMVDRMLDWDKPLSEQPKAVRQALKSAGLTQYVDEMEASYLGSLPPQAQTLALKMINGSDEMVIAQGKGFKGNDIAARNWAQLERLAPGIDHNQIHDIRDWYASKNGADLYAEMSQGSGGRSAITASDRLRQMGIPGIRYLDAGSRGQGGSGTRNFVVFPGEEKKVKILKRE